VIRSKEHAQGHDLVQRYANCQTDGLVASSHHPLVERVNLQSTGGRGGLGETCRFRNERCWEKNESQSSDNHGKKKGAKHGKAGR